LYSYALHDARFLCDSLATCVNLMWHYLKCNMGNFGIEMAFICIVMPVKANGSGNCGPQYILCFR